MCPKRSIKSARNSYNDPIKEKIKLKRYNTNRTNTSKLSPNPKRLYCIQDH